MERHVYTEYADGSYLTAKIRNGELVECPIIKISPPFEWGEGSMSLEQALEFLSNIKEAEGGEKDGG